jgi:hypothetical protein
MDVFEFEKASSVPVLRQRHRSVGKLSFLLCVASHLYIFLLYMTHARPRWFWQQVTECLGNSVRSCLAPCQIRIIGCLKEYDLILGKPGRGIVAACKGPSPRSIGRKHKSMAQIRPKRAGHAPAVPIGLDLPRIIIFTLENLFCAALAGLSRNGIQDPFLLIHNFLLFGGNSEDLAGKDVRKQGFFQ